MSQTDAQWASTAVQNRRDRDRRRKRRRDDPAFRAREAAEAKRYRNRRKDAQPIEALHCSRCGKWWHRMKRAGSPKTCPACRRQCAKRARALRLERIAAGVCVVCTTPMDRTGTLCRGCADHHSARHKARKAGQ